MKTGSKILYKGSAFVVGAYFLILGLIKAKPFLAPLATAVILALLMVPVSEKMEKWGMKRIFSSLTNTILLFAVSIGFAAVVSLQLSEFISDWDNVQDRLMPLVEKVEHMVYNNTPIEEEDLKMKDSVSSENMGKQALTFISMFYSFVGDFLLTFIYIFFLLNYRAKFREFFVRIFPKDKRKEVSQVLAETADITQSYLLGKFILMVLLAITYAIGMGLTGVENFIVISILAAVLSIIPYIGNIIGFVLAIGLGYVTNGDTTALIGIVATFAIVQFIESYVFEPYIVGDKVNLDPLMTILVVVVGSLMWGVIGMILSVPVLGIANLIFKHVEPLKPVAFLLSANKEKDDDAD